MKEELSSFSKLIKSNLPITSLIENPNLNKAAEEKPRLLLENIKESKNEMFERINSKIKGFKIS